MERIIKRVYTIAVVAVSQSSAERVGVLQSIVPVLEEPIGTSFTVNDLYFTGKGCGFDQSGQENESNCESTAEYHRVEEEREAGSERVI